MAVANTDSGTEFTATPPDGYVWDIRCIDAIYSPDEPDTSRQQCAVQLNFSLLVRWLPMRIDVTYHWEGRQILYPGELLRVTKNFYTGLGVLISGYELIDSP